MDLSTVANQLDRHSPGPMDLQRGAPEACLDWDS